MSSTKIWMPLYVADYLADTTRLTTEQHGAYILLIMDYWRNGALPDDDCDLANITRMPLSAWKKSRPALLRFFYIEGNEWRHKRIDAELEEANENAQRYAERAKKAAAKRWGKDGSRDATSIPKGELIECTSPSPSPTTNSSTKNLKDTLSDSYSPEFEAAWKAYPSRPNNNKAMAFKAWKARIKSGVSPETMIEGAKRYAAYCKTSISSQQYIKQAATFFGPDEHYAIEWLPTDAGQPRRSKMNDMGLEMTAEEFTRSYEDQGFKVARP